jgi:hypothetical protein
LALTRFAMAQRICWLGGAVTSDNLDSKTSLALYFGKGRLLYSVLVQLTAVKMISMSFI